MSAARIVALLHNTDQQRIIRRWCELSARAVEQHHELDAFRRAVGSDDHLLVLLGWDSDQPEHSAHILRQTRCSIRDQTRIIVLADRDREADIVKALELGADRYLQIDTPWSVLDAMIGAVLRRITAETHIRHYEPYLLDEQKCEVLRHGERIQLTSREFRITHFLFSHSGVILSRETLLLELWDLPKLDNSRRVDTKMSHVRRKLTLDGSYGWQLRFSRGQGYQLTQTDHTP